MSIQNIRNGINSIIDESEEIRSVLCADIVFASKYIDKSVFPQPKKFDGEIAKIFDILNKKYMEMNRMKKVSKKAKEGHGNDERKFSEVKIHPYLKDKEAYNELVAMSKKDDSKTLALILSKIPKYRNILSLFDLYSIIRIINEFSIEYCQYIKTPYYEERLKLSEK